MDASSPRKRNRRYTAAEKAEFFRRLDRGGTIRAVAAELGLSPDVCYRWRHESGTSTARGRPRAYSAAEKAEFFRRLAVTPNVSAVARELGFVRVTCYKWAHQAGIFTGKDTTAQREEFLGLRAEGLSRAQAAARVGVDKRNAQDWDKGIRVFYGGRVVRYGQAAILANVKTPRTAYTRGAPDDVERLERPISGRFLSLSEREQIQDLHVREDSVRAIAAVLGRAPSTIARELARNTATAAGYLPYAAPPGCLPPAAPTAREAAGARGAAQLRRNRVGAKVVTGADQPPRADPLPLSIGQHRSTRHTTSLAKALSTLKRHALALLLGVRGEQGFSKRKILEGKSGAVEHGNLVGRPTPPGLITQHLAERGDQCVCGCMFKLT